MSRRTYALVALFVVISLRPAAAGLTFNFTEGSGLTALASSDPAKAQNFRNGFAAAANEWSSRLADNITVNLSIDVASLGSGVLGSASVASQVHSYTEVRTALAARATSLNDLTAVANLQLTPSLDFYTNQTPSTSVVRVRDNNGSANNSFLDVPRANLKALGIVASTDAASDGALQFSSDFNFDFDRSNGVSGFDFVSVASHEIGHLLGFISGVDIVDIVTGAGPQAGNFNLDNFAVFSTLDLYRYSQDSAATAGGILELTAGGTGAQSPYFSLDRGATNLGPFSNGDFNGNRQASHWLDNQGLGLLDPTLGPGEVSFISDLDLLAMDVIGYRLTAIPEPSSLALVSLAGLFLLRRRRPELA